MADNTENTVPAQDQGQLPDSTDTNFVETVMKFDPFAPSEDQTDPAPESEKEEKVVAEHRKKEALQAPVPPVSPEPPQQKVDPQLEALRAELAAERAERKKMLDMLAAQQAKPQPQQPTQPQQQQPAKRYANRTVSPEVMTAINSEDATRAQAGMSHLVQSVMETVYGDVMEAVEQRLQDLQARVPELASNVVQSTNTAQQFGNAFFAANPHLATPERRQLVAYVAQAINAEATANGQTLGFSVELMNEIARRANGMLGYSSEPSAAPQPQAQPQRPAARQPARAQFTTGSGASPSVPAPDNPFSF